MAPVSPDVLARLRQTYKGIEGLYILNRSGQLGYITDDGTHLERETFNGVDPDQAERFSQELARRFRDSPPDTDQELGYLQPADDSRVWKTANLMLHEHVAKSLRDAFERQISKGGMSLAEGERKAPDAGPERGLHRGFDELLNHVGTFGIQTYFPVLFFRPAGTTGADYPLRVLNLMSLLDGAGRFGEVLAAMRAQMTELSAGNLATRVENRFTLQDED